MPDSQGAFIEKVKKAHGRCHLLCQIPAVLADERIFAIMDDLQKAKVKTLLHLFLCAEEETSNTGLQFVLDLEHKIKGLSPFTAIAGISGAYYLYQETGPVLRAITAGEAPRFFAASVAVRSSYKNAVFDQFMKPAVVADYRGIANNDGFWFYGFSPKETLALQRVFTQPDFSTLLFTN